LLLVERDQLEARRHARAWTGRHHAALRERLAIRREAAARMMRVEDREPGDALALRDHVFDPRPPCRGRPDLDLRRETSALEAIVQSCEPMLDDLHAGERCAIEWRVALRDEWRETP